MKILQIAKHVPYPAKDGYSIAVTSIAQSLISANHIVDLFTMNTTKHWIEPYKIPQYFNGYRQIFTERVDNSITVKGAFFNLFEKTSYLLSRFISEQFAKRLSAILRENQYDIVLLESVHLCVYIENIRSDSNTKIALRTHNVEFEIWERQIANAPFSPKSLYLKTQLPSFRAFEIDQLQKIDYLIGITQKDLDNFKYLGFNGPSISIPVGIDFGRISELPRSAQSNISLSFIGSLDWQPNLEGMQWFLEKVFPNLENVQIHIAGRHMPDHIRKRANKNIIIEGEVENAHTFLLQHPIMIVPLFSGSGIRVKIIEGLALGRVIITTTLGMEGILATDGVEILIADTIEDFISKIKYCQENHKGVKKISERAKSFAFRHFEIRAIGETLSEFLGGET